MRPALRRRHNDEGPGTQPTNPDELWRVNWRQIGLPYCGVYVITTDSLYPCKVGVSVNPVKRLTTLQTSHWRPLQISGYRWAETANDAKAIEKEVHRALAEKGKALLGEWFDVRVPEAVEAIEWASMMTNIPVHRHIPDNPDVEWELMSISLDTSMAHVLGKRP